VEFRKKKLKGGVGEKTEVGLAIGKKGGSKEGSVKLLQESRNVQKEEPVVGTFFAEEKSV